MQLRQRTTRNYPKHLIKFCMTVNLGQKLEERYVEQPDAELIARFPVATKEKAFAICNTFNERSTESDASG